jgi:hypothetical protein
MLRALAKFILILVVVVAAAAFFMGYRWGGVRTTRSTVEPAVTTHPVGTAGSRSDDRRERARAAGAEVGEKIAVGADKASEGLEEAALTAKVKSKMALDDTLDGSRIHVSSDNNQVTLTGTVVNETQHTRALMLARETAGVGNVVDHLSVGTR